jgi:ribosome-binding factor A
MPTIRQAKVGEMIKRELAEVLQKSMRDPRLALVSVNDVEVARDFTYAKVFISYIGSEEEKNEALKALNGATGFLRGHLGRVMDMRTIPALAFRYDTGVDKGIRMYDLLQEEQVATSQNRQSAEAAGLDPDTIDDAKAGKRRADEDALETAE